MQIIISKSSAPYEGMSGDMFDSRVARLTNDFCPCEKVPRIYGRDDGSLVVDLTNAGDDARQKILDALSSNCWCDVTIKKTE